MLFSVTGLTAPTAETAREYGREKLYRLQRMLSRFNQSRIRVSVTKERYYFVVSVELITVRKPLIVKVKNEDLRKAIDEAVGIMKSLLSKAKPLG